MISESVKPADLKGTRPFRAEFISRHPGTAVFLFLLAVYLVTPTSDYYWDGITFALQIEKVAGAVRGPSLLFHQNHLLYEGLGYVLYRAAASAGLRVPALQLLQAANAVAGAAAAAIFFRVALRTTGNLYAALVSSLALGFSAVWWKMATDADAYMLSILLLLVCADVLLSRRPRWWLAGLALAGAMLFHELASLFYPAAIVAALRNHEVSNRWKFVGAFSAVAWGITVGVYYAVARLALGLSGPLEVVRWAASNQSGVTMSPDAVRGLWLMLRGTLDLIAGHSFGLFRQQGGWVGPLLALLALAVLVAFAVAAMRSVRLGRAIASLKRVAPPLQGGMRRALPVALVWTAAYLAFLIFWEPWQVYYRVFYAPALALILALVLANYHAVGEPTRHRAAALGVAALALLNLAFYIAPHMRGDANPMIAAARRAGEVWGDRTVIFFAGHNSADTTFEYFNRQTRWRRLAAKRRADQGSDPHVEIERERAQGGAVWLNQKAAEMVDGDWLARRRGREISVDGPGPSARYIEVLGAR